MHYLCLSEISSLSCEKDFLLSSLDEIDALILKRQEYEESKSFTPATKRIHSPAKVEEVKRQTPKHGSTPLETSEPAHTTPGSDVLFFVVCHF